MANSVMAGAGQPLEIEPGACPLCAKQPREDDATMTTWVDGLGMVFLCSPCATGSPPRRWEHGRRVPLRHDGDAHIRVCAACRLALRRHERQTTIRLLEEDVCDTNTPHGALIVCEGCLARWRPVIACRLLATGLIADPDQAAGDMLL